VAGPPTGCEDMSEWDNRNAAYERWLRKQEQQARFEELPEREPTEELDVDINSCFPGSYLKAADLQNRTIKCIIDRVQMETIGDEDKPVLYFQGKDKGLVLNKTNSGSISALYGAETDAWEGKEVKLFPTKVNYAGSMVDAIRIKLEPPEATEDDAIPF
jgi:hypothetical protein